MRTATDRPLPTLLALALLAIPTEAQLWENRNQLLVKQDPQQFEYFGSASAAGDFDGDGIDDLAVSAVGHDHTLPGGQVVENTGIVYLYRGTPQGLQTGYWWSVLLLDPGALTGFSMVARDFDDDGRDELAVGAPGASALAQPATLSAGQVLYFDWDPATGFATRHFFSSGCGCETQEANEEFGFSVGAGDFDGDGYAELVVSTPYETAGAPPVTESGVVHVIRGSSQGPLDGPSTQLWSEGQAGWLGRQAGGHFGHSIATGLFDFDQYEDLAIGEPYRSYTGAPAAGQVRVIYGSASGLSASDAQSLDGGSTGVGRQENEHFGWALAADDFNFPGDLILCLFGACLDDLAIGAPGYAPNPTALSAGRIVVVPGQITGLDLPAGTAFTQQSLGGAASEAGDEFGYQLAAGRMDGRPGSELVVSSPYEILNFVDQGLVHLLFGGSAGVNSHPHQTIDARPGFPLAPGGAGELLGYSIAVGDFDDDGVGDLAIGVPGYAAGGLSEAGAVQVLYGALFADGFERGSTGGWSAP